MTAIVVNQAPFVPVKPTIKIGTGGTAVQIECAGGELVVAPEQDQNEVETFCGVFTYYKPEKWMITLTAYVSYGADGLWNALRPLVGTTQTFQILPDAATAVGVGNPKMSGSCRVKGFPFFSGGPGEPTSFDLELAVLGIPTFATTGTITLSAEEAEAEAQALADAEADTPQGVAPFVTDGRAVEDRYAAPDAPPE